MISNYYSDYFVSELSSIKFYFELVNFSFFANWFFNLSFDRAYAEACYDVPTKAPRAVSVACCWTGPISIWLKSSNNVSKSFVPSSPIIGRVDEMQLAGSG